MDSQIDLREELCITKKLLEIAVGELEMHEKVSRQIADDYADHAIRTKSSSHKSEYNQLKLANRRVAERMRDSINKIEHLDKQFRK